MTYQCFFWVQDFIQTDLIKKRKPSIGWIPKINLTQNRVDNSKLIIFIPSTSVSFISPRLKWISVIMASKKKFEIPTP